MGKDRVFFDPGPLAFGKGCAYLLAFLTAVFFIKSTEKAYVFGVITYSCGCICDYIEVATREDKNLCIRLTSAALAILMAVLVVIALGMAAMYDANESIKAFLINNRIWVNLFLVTFFAIPLENGGWLIIKSIRGNNKGADSLKNVSGFFTKP